jgi:hypothetical protein
MNSQRQRPRGRSRQNTSDVDQEHRLWLAFVISFDFEST